MSKQFNPVGHGQEKADIYTTYEVGVNGLRVLLNHWDRTHKDQPNYFLVHVEDYRTLFMEISQFNPSFGHELPHSEVKFMGIKIIRSFDLSKGQIQLV